MSIISTVGHDVNGILLYFYSLYRVRGLLAHNFLNCLLHKPLIRSGQNLHSIPHTTPATQYKCPFAGKIKGPSTGESVRSHFQNILRRMREDG
jgi:hypothetical protein